MTSGPMFSVVVTDYDASIPRDYFRRKMADLAAQSCNDFEVLVYHDGPKHTPYATELDGMQLHPATRFITTEARQNDWGHSNRDRGIHEAKGEWIIHTNADNVFYPDMIATLKAAATDGAPSFAVTKHRFPIIIKSIVKRVDRYFGTNLRRETVCAVDNPDVLVYAIRMQGMVAGSGNGLRRTELAGQRNLIFGGVPVRRGHIDAMQFVMRRNLWIAEGGWSDKRADSDGYLYERFARKYVVRAVPEVLGEHW